jgi:hypothetical protein
MDILRNRWKDRQIVVQTEKQRVGKEGRQTNKHTDRHSGSQNERRRNGQSNIKAERL